MKKNLILFGALGEAVIVAILLMRGTLYSKPSLAVRQIAPNTITIGNKDKSLLGSTQEQHNQQLKAIDQASELRLIGAAHSKAGRLSEAADSYREAYSLDSGSRAVSGLLLAVTYEKLGRYDEGISLLDDMINNHYLSQKGIQNANEIKSRLIAAKSVN